MCGLKGRVIYRCRDELGTIEVVESHGVRALHFGTDARQSAIDLSAPERIELSYLRAMLVGLAFVAEPRRILVLGLGGGVLARFLAAHYPDARIDVIEYRPAVVEVARRYFGLPDHEGLKIRIGDAGVAVPRLSRRLKGIYDLALVDVFDERGLAPCAQRPEFFEALARLLGESGVLAINLWSSHVPIYRHVMGLIRLNFPSGAHVLPVPGRANVIGVGLGEGARRCVTEAGPGRLRSLEFGLGVEFGRFLGRFEPPLRPLRR